MRGCGVVGLLVFSFLSAGVSLSGSSSVVLDPPRTSYPLNSPGRPLARFTDAPNTTTLLLSDDGSTLYVGARDAVLSLDVSQPGVIAMKKKVEWKPSDGEVDNCSNKGRNRKTECGNFVKVLQAINSTHLYACGSFAYNPQDMLFDAESLSMVRTSAPTTKHCPYNPLQRNTAITINGELFYGTTIDFRGNLPVIARHFSQDGRPDVTQDTSSSFTLLNEPTFVSSSSDPAEGKVLFFFTEVAKEHSFVQDLRMPRVAQVCKSDVGGKLTLVGRWTSFAKAPLLCQMARELPFNVLQDMTTLHPVGGDGTADTLFYGVFTSQWSIGPGSSAVCVFKMSDIRAAFDGNYKKLDMDTNQWKPAVRKHALGKCGLGNATGSVLEEVKKSFLTSDSVRQAHRGPLLVSTSQRYSRLVVERTQAANGKTYTMLFLLTENGFLHKVVLSEQGPRVIEEVQVFQHPQQMKSLILSSKGVVYVGTSEGVTQVPLTSCPSYQSCTQCVLARDPLCGWDHNRDVCTQVTAGASDIDMGQDVENGNVTKVCVSAKAAPPPAELQACWMDAVTLPCARPSSVATLRWIAPPSAPRELLLQRPDGSLSFPLAAQTLLGNYTCVSEEGGYEDDVASYSVKLRASPRGMPPPATRGMPAPATRGMPAPATRGIPAPATRGMQRTPATLPLEDIDGITAASAQRKTVADTTTSAAAAPTATKTSTSAASTEPSEAVTFVSTDTPHERSPAAEHTDLVATTVDKLCRTCGPASTERGSSSDTVAFAPSTAATPERRPVVPPTVDDLRHSTETIRNGDGPNAAPTAAEETDVTASVTVCRYPMIGDPDESKELRERVTREKSYFSELVAVSLLLAVCVCVLLVGLVSRWRQSHHLWLVPAWAASRSEKAGKAEAQDSPETVPSLSDEDSPPEVTIIAQSNGAVE